MNARKAIKSYREYKKIYHLTTLCDVCTEKEDCPALRLIMDAKRACWDSHHHSIRFDIPECSKFKPHKEARRFPIE